MYTTNEITGIIVDAAIEVHRTLGGPGLLETIYEEALTEELLLRDMEVERQKAVPVFYKGKQLAAPLRLDMLVENRVIVECKATTQFNPIFKIQTLTYLRLMKLRTGLVINFGEALVKKGVHRVFNNDL